MKIEKRALTPEEAEIISDEIRGTENIVGYSANELQSLGKMFVLEEDDEMLGVLLSIEKPTFLDLKLLIVKKDHRGRGYGRSLYESFRQDVANDKRIIYSVTKNPIIIKWLSESGYSKESFFKMPLPIQLHQVKMVFNLYRIKEFFRKKMFIARDQFSYWVTR